LETKLVIYSRIIKNICSSCDLQGFDRLFRLASFFHSFFTRQSFYRPAFFLFELLLPRPRPLLQSCLVTFVFTSLTFPSLAGLVCSYLHFQVLTSSLSCLLQSLVTMVLFIMPFLLCALHTPGRLPYLRKLQWYLLRHDIILPTQL